MYGATGVPRSPSPQASPRSSERYFTASRTESRRSGEQPAGGGDHGADALQHRIGRSPGLEFQQDQQGATQALEAGEGLPDTVWTGEELVEQFVGAGVVGVGRADIQGHQGD